MNLAYLENQHHWTSFDYFCRLLRKLVEYTGDPRVPFFAGTYTCKKETFGALSNIARRLGTPGTMYKFIAELTPRYSKVGKLKMLELKNTSCTMVLNMLPGYTQDKNNCINMQGIFASIPSLWDLPMAKVKEIQCAAEDADSCVYQITWANRLYLKFGLCGLLIGMGITILAIVIPWITLNKSMLIIIPLIGFLLGRIKDYKIAIKGICEVNDEESNHLVESIETIEKMNVDLQEKVELRTKKLRNALDELKKSQNQLVQSEKMASVGRLAAGMAHELNNPVGAIRNYLQDVLEDLSDDSPINKRLLQAERATGRCKKIVNNLLTFSRESKDLTKINLNNLIGTTLLMARQEMIKPKIRIITDLAPDLPEIETDSMQLQQVFTNILANANDAIEKQDGKITVKTFLQKGNIHIEISDTGSGIPNEIHNKIFDPFFTTKSPGKGTGLGLSISYNIIKRFGGDIKIHSKEGRGTTFSIILPISATVIKNSENHSPKSGI